MHANAAKRHEILGHLYEMREAKPKNGWATEYDLKARFGEVTFSLGVLKELGYIQEDGPRYRIVGAGVLACEAIES